MGTPIAGHPPSIRSYPDSTNNSIIIVNIENISSRNLANVFRVPPLHMNIFLISDAKIDFLSGPLSRLGLHSWHVRAATPVAVENPKKYHESDKITKFIPPHTAASSSITAQYFWRRSKTLSAAVKQETDVHASGPAGHNILSYRKYNNIEEIRCLKKIIVFIRPEKMEDIYPMTGYFGTFDSAVRLGYQKDD